MATHYGTAVIPARVRHPRDKAKVETGVQVVEYWVIAPLRNRQFFSIGEINRAIRERLEDLNNKEMRHLGKSRHELFEELDRPALKSLPERVYELAEWKRAKVSIDYHVEYTGHYYSVPYQLIHKNVDIRATAPHLVFCVLSRVMGKNASKLPVIGLFPLDFIPIKALKTSWKQDWIKSHWKNRSQSLRKPMSISAGPNTTRECLEMKEEKIVACRASEGLVFRHWMPLSRKRGKRLSHKVNQRGDNDA